MSGKPDVITFKVEPSLSALMRGIGNRSEFIRAALLAALGNLCPLCKGSGILTPKKKQHWDEFSIDHRLKECRECRELTVVCKRS